MPTITTDRPSLLDDAWGLVQTSSHFLSRTFTQVEGTDKCLKAIMAWGDLAAYFQSSESYTIMNGQFRNLTSMFGALNSFNRIKEWVLADERAKFINSTKKTTIKALLTAANFLESIKYLDTLKLIELGVVNSHKVALPILERVIDLSPISVAKDLSVVVASVITLTDADGAVRVGRNDARKSEIDHYKAQKWALKQRVAEYLNDPVNVLNIAQARQQLAQDGNVNKDAYIRIRTEIEGRRAVPRSRQEIEQKWNLFINDQARINHAVNNGERSKNFWRLAEEIHSNTLTKAIISIANDLGKIAIITTALVGLTILGFKMAAFMVPFLVLGTVVASIGFVKFLFDDWYKQKETALNSSRVGNLNVQSLSQKY